MRALTIVGLALAGAAASGAAQHAHRFEVGAFGSFNRYDDAFDLDNQFGFGGRFGYLFGGVIGLELDAGYQAPSPQTGTGSPTLAHGSVSLVLNVGGERNLFYLLGGYSRLDFGPSAPYRFTDNAVHGAIGDRIFLGSRAALRLEVRAVYAPSTGLSGGTWAGHVQASAGLSFFAAGGPPPDADGDGVADRRDTCPATPGGATVDPAGCPADADGDGVFNGLDTCPNTPTGAQTDGAGCPLDADADGVYDGLDQCPGTVGGAQVDTRGCPADGDADGVPDGVDRCPTTPAGAQVDSVGCPKDSDSDSVPDGIDRCPSTPAGTEVDLTGCAVRRDADGDGVDDERDRCPDTAAGTRVDAAGCPILFEDARTPVVLRGVTFETGRSALRSESFAVLDIVAASLLANAEVRIEIAGHTDDTGPDAVNQRLSEARAAAVRQYLASKGVDAGRMVARGHGESMPIATNTTPDGRAQNRRVELRQIP